MRNPEYYRLMISKRTAVKALCEINKALNGGKHVYFWSTDGISQGSYDRAVYSMADDIRRMVEELKEFREFKKTLKNILE